MARRELVIEEWFVVAGDADQARRRLINVLSRTDRDNEEFIHSNLDDAQEHVANGSYWTRGSSVHKVSLQIETVAA